MPAGCGGLPLTMVPLELQRRIIDQAIGNEDLRLLALLGAVHPTTALAAETQVQYRLIARRLLT